MEKYLRVAVIMAGGAGERFWPLSRQQRPKQLLRLTDPQVTMLEEAIRRVEPLIPHERIYIATSAALAEPIRQARIGVPPGNVLAEPCKRNTAGCMTYVAAQMIARHGERVCMAVLTADHRIGKPGRFRETVAAAMTAAEQNGAIVTIGVTPDRPETGYGYIEAQPVSQPPHAAWAGEAGAFSPVPIMPVISFHEKPDAATAARFLAGRRFYWNSGMFFWTVPALLRELDAASPAHSAAARAIAAALKQNDDLEVTSLFSQLPDISIDYALMEKAKGVMMAQASFPWDDVGSWDALDRGWPRDAQGNVSIGAPVLIDSSNNIVYNEPGLEHMAVAAVGVRDMIIVISRDAVLIAPKDRAQEVKKAVAELKSRDARQI